MKKLILLIALIILALSSEFLITPAVTNPDFYFYKGIMEELDEKRSTVLELTGSASATSIAIAAVPGDSTTPIADKIMDLTGYFVIVLCAIIMEKYLLTLTGCLTFKFLIPVACAMFAFTLFINIRAIRQLALRVTLFGLLIFAVVPVSVQVTGFIEKTYETSINDTIDKAKQVEKDVEIETTESTKAEESTQATSEKSSGILDAVEDLKNKISETKKDVQEKITETAGSVVQLSEDTIAEAEDMINDFIETVVVMLVTSCVIPMLVLVFFVWIAKTLVLMDFDWEKNIEKKNDLKVLKKTLQKDKPEKESIKR